MRYGKCSHHLIWDMQGDTVKVRCAHCHYIRTTFESTDQTNDRRRSQESQLSHKEKCNW